MEQWISAAKVKKMLNISSEKLDRMELEGKVKTILTVGNRKLYLLSSLKENKESFISKFLSWIKFK